MSMLALADTGKFVTEGHLIVFRHVSMLALADIIKYIDLLGNVFTCTPANNHENDVSDSVSSPEHELLSPIFPYHY